MMREVKRVFSKYAVFDGRASRREYWFFTLFDICVTVLLTAMLICFSISAFSGSDIYSTLATITGIIFAVYRLALFIPTLAVTCRRLHDVNRSGAYIFISLIPLVGVIILLIKLAEQSYWGTNGYGPMPDNADIGEDIHDSPVIRPPQKQYPTERTAMGSVMNVHEPKVQIKIICNSGALAGQAFSSCDKLCIGRRKDSCNVVFPENTRGISRVHCCLTIDHGQLVLVDMGSSYGTFLENGKKLQPNEPVKINDNTRFYLADKNTCFTAYIEIR